MAPMAALPPSAIGLVFVALIVVIVLPLFREFKIIDEGEYVDPKSKLQEMSQEKLGLTPTYMVVSETGPDHDKVFVVAAMVGKNEVGQGKGPSKQEAETEAAKAALEKYKK